MVKKNVPPRLWDFGFQWICETGNLSVSSSKYAKGRTSVEYFTGETPDISEYLEFGFYDWVTFTTNAGLGETMIGRWLGVSHKVGQLMSYWISPVSGIPISCVTVQRLTNLEQNTREYQQKMDDYDNKIGGILKFSIPIAGAILTVLMIMNMYGNFIFIAQHLRGELRLGDSHKLMKQFRNNSRNSSSECAMLDGERVLFNLASRR